MPFHRRRRRGHHRDPHPRTWTDTRRAAADPGHQSATPGANPRRLRPIILCSHVSPDGVLDATTVQPEYCRGFAPRVVTKRIVPTLPPPPTRFIVPFIDIVHNREALEIQRVLHAWLPVLPGGHGLSPRPRASGRGSAGRGGRNRPSDRIEGDRFPLAPLIGLQRRGRTGEGSRRAPRRKKLSIGLPSLRIDTFSIDLTDSSEKGRRRSGFTFA